ncbi:MAG: hypothetical protein HYW69_00055, partial [Candidatus Nealsonbacteria bacterium]|nr:hypothetical protein [Candidatus Nealsonbacteria bacterium]
EYMASVPEPIFIDDNTSANTTGAAFGGATGCTSATACYVYKELNLTKVSAGTTPGLVVYIYGDFSASGVGTNDIDIFAGGSSGFKVKQVTLNSNYSATPYSTVLNLPATGDYNIGMGPAMPKVMGKTAPKMPTNWLPPKPVNVSVSGSGGTWTWAEVDGTSVGTSTADGLVKFSIQAANKTISGYVYDTSGTAVSNAEIFAYSPSEFFGTSAHSRSDGSFTLNVKTGFYKVGAFLPGAPSTSEIGVEVRDSSVYVDGVLTTSLTLKISKDIQSGYTISGTVYSDTNSKYPATDVSVYAYRTDGPGRADAMTDSKGTYTLYVGAGTWKIGASLGSYGKITEKTITVPPSKSGLKLTPDTTTNYVTIRERIWEDKNDNLSYDAGEGVSRASVSFVATSTDYVNTAVTDSSGVYELKVPATTTYDMYVWSPDVGSLPPEKNKIVTSTDIIYTSFSGFVDLRIEKATTVEFGIYASGGTTATTADKLLIRLERTGITGASNDIFKEGVATTTMSVSTSTASYVLDIRVQGIPKDLLTITTFDANTAITTSTVGTKLFATTTVNDYEKIKVILPPISYVSGQVQDESGNAVGSAILHIEQPGKDVEFDVEADSSGNYSFRVASSSSPYLIQADKGGYVDSAVSVYASTSAVAFNPSIQTSNNTISGTVSINGAVPGGTEVYVWAEQLSGGYASTAKGDPQTGTYTLKVTSGDWEVHAAAEGYSAQAESLIIQTSGGNKTGVNFNIATSRTLTEQETLGMAGNVGGTLTDKDSGFGMAIPRSALSASDSSSYNVSHKEVSNIPTFTPTGKLVGGKASSVSAYKPNGAGGNASTIAGLQAAAFIEKTYTVTELSTEGITTSDQVEETKMGSYDSTVNNWTSLPTTISYVDSTDKPVVPNATLSNVSKVTFRGATKHFSTFGVINTKYDGLAPSAPTSVSVSDLGNGSLQVSWNGVTTNPDGTTANDIQRYAIYRSQGSSGIGSWSKIATVPVGTTSYTDTVSGGVYYYRVTADTGLQSGFSSASSGASSSFGGSSGGSGGSGGGGGAPSAPAPAPVPAVPAPEAPKKIAQAPEAPKAEAPAKKEATLEGITIPKLEKAVSQMTKIELTAKIAEFLSAISQLQVLVALLAAQETPSISGVPADFKFAAVLKSGQTSDDIKHLQIILNSDPATIIAETGSGSSGKETKFFGALTRAAVIKFQEKYASEVLTPYGLTKGTGLVGPATRAKLNELLGK